MTDPTGDLDALIVGAGFCGLYLLHRLRAEGFAVRLDDAADGPGGVWHWNGYPGARVDSHWPNYELSIEAVWRDWYWDERFPGRDELCRYFDHVVDVLGLGARHRVGTRVGGRRRSTRRSAAWTSRLDDGASAPLPVRLLACTGFALAAVRPRPPGPRPSSPASATTRPDGRQGGVEMAGRRVGVLGTGASGVQVVQEARKVAAELTVFQRTPVMALPMGQRALTRAEQDAAKATIRTVFARRRVGRGGFGDMARHDVGALDVERRRAAGRLRGGVGARAASTSGAGRSSTSCSTSGPTAPPTTSGASRTRARISDPSAAELLAPEEPPYPFGTKRPSLEQGVLRGVQPAERRTSSTCGRHRSSRSSRPACAPSAGESDLDVLVLATGFDANTGGLTAPRPARHATGARCASAGPAGSTPTSGSPSPGSRTC